MRYFHTQKPELFKNEDNQIETVLSLVCRFGNSSNVTRLVEKFDANINERGPNQWNCVLAAAAGGQNATLKYFYKNNPDLFYSTDSEGNTLLQLAKIYNHETTEQLLIGECCTMLTAVQNNFDDKIKQIIMSRG